MLSVFACDYFNPRFDTEQVPNIENVLILLREDNLFGWQEISCIPQLRKRAGLTIGSNPKSKGKLAM